MKNRASPRAQEDAKNVVGDVAEADTAGGDGGGDMGGKGNKKFGNRPGGGPPDRGGSGGRKLPGGESTMSYTVPAGVFLCFRVFEYTCEPSNIAKG